MPKAQLYGRTSGAVRLPIVATTDGELMITETEREKNRVSYYVRSSVGETVWVALVDLSDTTNWKHTETGRIDISYVEITVDRASNSVGSVDLGVVTRVDGTNGDVKFFASANFNNAADNFIRVASNYAPSQFKLGVTGGVLNQLVSNAGVTNSTSIQTDVSLDSFRGTGTVAPAVGDIVVRFAYTSGGAYVASALVFYHGEASA